VSFRDRDGSPNRGVPIFVHTYDYTTPSLAPARIYDLIAVDGVGPETTGRCGDWQNEIHPSRAGYQRLAALFTGVVDQHLRRMGGCHTGKSAA
jgi:hypothetical protein